MSAASTPRPSRNRLTASEERARARSAGSPTRSAAATAASRYGSPPAPLRADATSDPSSPRHLGFETVVAASLAEAGLEERDAFADVAVGNGEPERP